MLKAYVCKAAEWVTREAMQIHGGMGYAEEYDVSRYFVDARVLSIFEGADETLCLKLIARRMAVADRDGWLDGPRTRRSGQLAAFGVSRLTSGPAYLATVRARRPSEGPSRATDHRGESPLCLHGADFSQGPRPARATLVRVAQRRTRQRGQRRRVLGQRHRAPAG